MDKKTVLQIISVILASALIFTAFVFAVTRTKPLVSVEVPKNDIVYEPPIDYPKDTTVLFNLEDGFSLCLKLEFEKGFISALILENANQKAFEGFGFYATETVDLSYKSLMDFIDTIDGINLDIFGEEMRYTGVQVCNIIAVNKDHIETKIKILKAIFNKIYKIGFSSDALYCIMNNTNNTLSVPDCYGWTDYLGEMCNRYNIVNEE